MTKLSRKYKVCSGGGSCPDDFWYEEDEIVLYEGDVCPECNDGKLKVSRRGKLYCSKLCWLKDDENQLGVNIYK